MRINNLTLKNFKSYYNKSTIDLSVDENKNIILIVADSGFGKTTLMQAINWVLYDDYYFEKINENRKKKDKVTLDQWINTNYKAEILKNKKIGELEVEMNFDHDNIKYQITNSITFTVNDIENINIESHSHTLKKLQQNGDWSTVSTLDSEINKILPRNIVQYFFFDAEKQSKLTDPSNSKQVKEAIYNVIGLKNLEDTSQNLKTISSDFNKQLFRLPLGNFTTIQERVIELKERIEENEEKVEDLKEEIQNITNFIDEIDQKLKNLPDSSSVQEVLNELKIDHDRLLDEKKEIEKEIANSSVAMIPSIIKDVFLSVKVEFDTLKDSGAIPGTISSKLIEEIIDAKICICGLKLDENPLQKERLEQLSNEISKTSYEKSKLVDVYHIINGYLANLDFGKLEFSHSAFIEKIDAIESAMSSIEEEIKIKKGELGDIDNNEVQGLNKSKGDFEKLIGQHNEEKGSCKNQIQVDKKELELKEIELDKLEIKDASAKRLRTLIKLTDSAKIELEEIFQKFAEDTRKLISASTKKLWNNLIETTKLLDFEIDESFRFSVKNKYGGNAINDLSEGQKQGLVLAFVSAISEVSEIDPPYIIDMPFGRLGAKSQTEVAKLLPNANKQLILLLNKASEYNDTTKKYLQPKCNNMIELTFDNEMRRTILN